MDVVFDNYFELLNKDIRILPLKSNMAEMIFEGFGMTAKTR